VTNKQYCQSCILLVLYIKQDTLLCTPSPSFTLVCFMPLCFNVPCQFTPRLNIHPVIFGLTPVGWSYFHWFESLLCKYFIFLPFWFISTFSGTQLGHKTRLWCLDALHTFSEDTLTTSQINSVKYMQHTHTHIVPLFTVFIDWL